MISANGVWKLRQKFLGAFNGLGAGGFAAQTDNLCASFHHEIGTSLRWCDVEFVKKGYRLQSIVAPAQAGAHHVYRFTQKPHALHCDA
jgi:hypothetical protein